MDIGAQQVCWVSWEHSFYTARTQNWGYMTPYKVTLSNKGAVTPGGQSLSCLLLEQGSPRHCSLHLAVWHFRISGMSRDSGQGRGEGTVSEQAAVAGRWAVLAQAAAGSFSRGWHSRTTMRSGCAVYPLLCRFFHSLLLLLFFVCFKIVPLNRSYPNPRVLPSFSDSPSSPTRGVVLVDGWQGWG